jgi:hypothetical protein
MPSILEHNEIDNIIHQRIHFFWEDENENVVSVYYDDEPFCRCVSFTYQSTPGASQAIIEYIAGPKILVGKTGSGLSLKADETVAQQGFLDDRSSNAWVLITGKTASGATWVPLFLGKLFSSTKSDMDNGNTLYSMNATCINGLLSQQIASTHTFSPSADATFFDVTSINAFNIDRGLMIQGNAYIDPSVDHETNFNSSYGVWTKANHVTFSKGTKKWAFTDPTSVVDDEVAQIWTGADAVCYILQEAVNRLLPSNIAVHLIDGAGLHRLDMDQWAVAGKSYNGMLQDIINKKRGLLAWWNILGSFSGDGSSVSGLALSMTVASYIPADGGSADFGLIAKNTVTQAWTYSGGAETRYLKPPTITEDGRIRSKYIKIETDSSVAIGSWRTDNGLTPYWGDATLPDSYNADVDYNMSTNYIYTTFKINPFANYQDPAEAPDADVTRLAWELNSSSGDLDWSTSQVSPSQNMRVQGSIPMEYLGNVTDILAKFDADEEYKLQIASGGEETAGVDLIRTVRNSIPMALFSSDDSVAADVLTVDANVSAQNEAIMIMASADWNGQLAWKNETERNKLSVTCAIDGLAPLSRTIENTEVDVSDSSTQVIKVKVKPIILLPNTTLVMKRANAGNLPFKAPIYTTYPIMIQKNASRLYDLFESYSAYFTKKRTAVSFSIPIGGDGVAPLEPLRTWELMGAVITEIDWRQDKNDAGDFVYEAIEVNSVITSITYDFDKGEIAIQTSYAEDLE